MMSTMGREGVKRANVCQAFAILLEGTDKYVLKMNEF